MASFTGTNGNDIVTPTVVSAGVVINPPFTGVGSPLTGDDVISVGNGNDTVEGDGGTDVASLGAGDDRFIWNPGDGDDSVFGGHGTDTLEFNGSDGAELMTVTNITGGFRFFRDLGNIIVDATRTEVIEVNALGGNDVIDASGQTRSSVAVDLVGGVGNDTFTGGSGNDSFLWDPGDGDDVFDGGNGTDTLRFNGSDGAEVMRVTDLGGGFLFFRDLGDITVENQNVERIEVDTKGGNDDFEATGASVGRIVLRTGDGDDTASGGRGDDWASLGKGNDRFIWNPGDGSDSVLGGTGTDTLEFNGSDGNEVMAVNALAGGVVQLFRDLGSIDMRLRDIERIEIDAKGGDDLIDARAPRHRRGRPRGRWRQRQRQDPDRCRRRPDRGRAGRRLGADGGRRRRVLLGSGRRRRCRQRQHRPRHVALRRLERRRGDDRQHRWQHHLPLP